MRSWLAYCSNFRTRFNNFIVPSTSAWFSFDANSLTSRSIAAFVNKSLIFKYLRVQIHSVRYFFRNVIEVLFSTMSCDGAYESTKPTAPPLATERATPIRSLQVDGHVQLSTRLGSSTSSTLNIKRGSPLNRRRT